MQPSTFKIVSDAGVHVFICGCGCELAFKEFADNCSDLGRTALHNSALSGLHLATRRLVEAGASTAVSDREGLTALHYASRNGQIEALSVLVDGSTSETLAQKATRSGLTYTDMDAGAYSRVRPWKPSVQAEDRGGWGTAGGEAEELKINVCSLT